MFFFDLSLPVLENANVRCEHNHQDLLAWNPFWAFDTNVNADDTCEHSFRHDTKNSIVELTQNDEV